MKQVIPYVKEIVFKTTIASITSISLEHEEKVYDNEVAGDFIIFGDYKRHNDTTEKELFKYRLPFTAILPDNAINDSIKIEIEDFTYDQIEEDVIKVNIDFSICYEEEKEEKRINEIENSDKVNEVIEETKEIDEETIREIEDFLKQKENDKKDREEAMEVKEEVVVEEETTPEEVRDEPVVVSVKEEDVKEEKEEEIQAVTKEEYVKYHIHIVKESETIEQIIKMYETNLETVKQYNEIDKIKTGDKLIIPENDES